MRCSEIIRILEELAPLGLACQWDNPGLLVGRSDKDVKKVYLALDATDEVIEAAGYAQADLLVTHHPLLFKPLKQVNDRDFIGRRVMDMIRMDLSYYAMHTNFDAAPGGMADIAAKRLGLIQTVVLEIEGVLKRPEGEVEYGIGRSGLLPREMTAEELAGLVKECFGLPFLTVYGEHCVEEPITCVAISPGSGKSAVACAVNKGIQVLITGDIGHHEGIDAAAQGLMVIDAGHYGLEHIFVDFMEEYLTGKLSGIEVAKAPVSFPASIR